MKRPLVWVLLALVSVAATAVAVRVFPQAFAIVSLDIRMDRQAALAAARDIMARDHLAPADYRQAASFTEDEETQTFVELEGGGKDAFTAMLRAGLYSAYTWRVRQFREGETGETTIAFRPDGQPDAFVEKVKEDAPGPALDASAARQIAERAAAADWHVDFNAYHLVEQGQEQRTSGRIDHTLTYERTSPTLGEGRYRVRLVVTGDRLTEVTPFVKVPEAFSRRYASLRSANDAIGVGSVLAAAVLYGLGGMGIGLFVMLRRRWVLWRQPIVWGAIIAFVQVLGALNDWPLLWMSYDTAVPRTLFFVQQIAGLGGAFVGYTVLFSLSFMTAETLTRRAFGSHPQLWRVWSRGPGSSIEILGRTGGGLLLVPLFFAYDVGLYSFATRHLGWWAPSEALLHSDVLAAYVPWFDAITQSMQAGFWEECLFRAVPIAGAALIGDRFGKRNLFIVIAFVVQAIVFGSGHAPYPNEPAFARPVELILPSIGFGLLYLYFGLVPGIILHFVFDTTWFALPIFVTHASGIWFERGMVIVATLTPLWVVLWRRVQAGRWTHLSPEDRNAAWTPAAPAAPVVVEPREIRVGIGGRTRTIWIVIAAAAVVLCAVVGFRSRAPVGLHIDRARATDVARRALEARGVTIRPPWRIMAEPQDATGATDEFVSETAGEPAREALRGKYLPVPRWAVRVASFEGDIAGRAEEWLVFVNNAGEAWPILHTLPEGRPGPSLSEAEARELADRALAAKWHFDPARGDVKEISAKPERLASRTDWTFTFVDKTVAPLPQGEPRIEVEIDGDEVVSIGRTVHVPETWTRAEEATGTRNGILVSLCAVVPAGLLVGAAIAGLMAWSRRRFSPRLFVLAVAQMLIASLLTAANEWPSVFFNLSTSQPVDLQIAIVTGVGLVGLAVAAALVALVAGMLPARLVPLARLNDAEAIRLGIAGGCVAAALVLVSAWLRTPVWAVAPDLGPLGDASPFAAAMIAPVTSVIERSLVLIAAFSIMSRGGQGWRALTFDVTALFVIGFTVGGGPVGSSLGGWVAGGVVMGAGFAALGLGLLLADLTMLPLAVGVMTAIESALKGASGPYPGAIVGGLAGAVVAIAIGWWWFRALRAGRAKREAAEGAAIAA